MREVYDAASGERKASIRIDEPNRMAGETMRVRIVCASVGLLHIRHEDRNVSYKAPWSRRRERIEITRRGFKG